MAILKFTEAELKEAENRISIRDQLSTATAGTPPPAATFGASTTPPAAPDPFAQTDPNTGQIPGTFTPLPLPDPPSVSQQDPAPQDNLIVESVTQRGDQPIEYNLIPNLIGTVPPDSDPYVQLPQEYRTQSGDNYYDLERPLDLVRFKLDRYWNILKYEGFFDNEGANPYSTRLESDNLPVKREDVSILNGDRIYAPPVWREGNVAPPITRYIDQSTAVANANPFGDPGLHVKEIIKLKANNSVFVLDPANLPGVTTVYVPPRLDPSLFGGSSRPEGGDIAVNEMGRTLPGDMSGRNLVQSSNQQTTQQPRSSFEAPDSDDVRRRTSRTNGITQGTSGGEFGNFGGYSGNNQGGSY